MLDLVLNGIVVLGINEIQNVLTAAGESVVQINN